MKTAITEKRNIKSLSIDTMSAIDIAKTINNEDKMVAYAVEKVLEEVALGIDLIANAFEKGGRLAYFGAGTSGRIATLDASECLPTFGVDENMVQAFIAGGNRALKHAVENAEDNEKLAIKDVKKFKPTKNDIIIGITAGGNAPYVIAALKEAQNSKAKTIGISSNIDANIKKYSNIFINPIVGEEIITGSSRMKSGSAQKMILNMLSTGAMVRIGKTYQNLMIDLKMTNKKLVDRGIRIVSDVAKITYDEAKSYIEKTNDVKLAIVMAVKKCKKAEAKKLLKTHKGNIKKIIL